MGAAQEYRGHGRQGRPAQVYPSGARPRRPASLPRPTHADTAAAQNFPYFHVEWGDLSGPAGGYAHVIEEESAFKGSFGAAPRLRDSLRAP